MADGYSEGAPDLCKDWLSLPRPPSGERFRHTLPGGIGAFLIVGAKGAVVYVRVAGRDVPVGKVGTGPGEIASLEAAVAGASGKRGGGVADDDAKRRFTLRQAVDLRFREMRHRPQRSAAWNKANRAKFDERHRHLEPIYDRPVYDLTTEDYERVLSERFLGPSPAAWRLPSGRRSAFSIRGSIEHAARKLPERNRLGEEIAAPVTRLLKTVFKGTTKGRSLKITLPADDTQRIIDALNELFAEYTPGQRPHGRDNPTRFPSAYLGVLLAIYTGMRKGMIMDLEVQHDHGDNLVIGTHKTIEKTGEPYVVPITRAVREVLARAEAVREAMRYRGTPDPERGTVHYVMPGQGGGRCSTIHIVLDDAVKLSGVKARKRITLHGLRAAYISRRLRQGDNVVEVANAVNHERASMTLDHYAVSTPEEGWRSAAASEAAFREELEAVRRGGAGPVLDANAALAAENAALRADVAKLQALLQLRHEPDPTYKARYVRKNARRKAQTEASRAKWEKVAKEAARKR